MHHLIVGYGYCGFHLASYLLEKNESVTAVSRHLKASFDIPGLNYISLDINTPLIWNHPDTILYYLIPPLSEGQHDVLLQQFLQTCRFIPAKIIYFGSSGVYGDHQGAWVKENALCHIDSSRQQRRLDAENKWMKFCKPKKIDCAILRIGGIYGPYRLPVQGALNQTPLIIPEQAPYINHIYVNDLARVAASLARQFYGQGIFNVADGAPEKMGTLQRLVGESLGYPEAPYENFVEAWEKASPMKREFMQTSKRLCITTLKKTLSDSLQLTPLATGIIASLKEEGH